MASADSCPLSLLTSRGVKPEKEVKLQSRTKLVRKENQVIGRINFYNHAKGYGFIAVTSQKSPTQAPSQEQFFFHYSNFRNGETPP